MMNYNMDMVVVCTIELLSIVILCKYNIILNIIKYMFIIEK